ncbi:hypothetical protein [Thauera sinica]|uniref:Uncharacterized protein n=1 Tax=Thauera sinica TaxID=2665146 RepID=A0ABW1AL88_9RHOO|nr:hypothetical protein [Thauera sp. K11]
MNRSAIRRRFLKSLLGLAALSATPAYARLRTLPEPSAASLPSVPLLWRPIDAPGAIARRVREWDIA